MVKNKSKAPKSSGSFVFMNPRTGFGFKKIFENEAILISLQPHFVERGLFYASHSILGQAPKGKVIKQNKKGEEVKIPWIIPLPEYM